MKFKAVIHEAEEGGYWAEVPSIPGCATQGDSFGELFSNTYEFMRVRPPITEYAYLYLMNHF